MDGQRRMPIWLALIGVIVSMPVIALLLLWAFKSVTTPIIHPDARQIRSAIASPPAQQWADAVQRGEQIIRDGLVEQNLPGVSVAVGADGEIVWAEGFGYADVEKKTTVAPNTGFRVADVSKALTSAGVGLLLEQNALRLDDEIQQYVPEFAKQQWPVTLRQLMAETAGVRTDPDGDAPISNAARDDGNPAPHCELTADGLKLDNFAKRDLLFEPDRRYSPSSYGWILVSEAIEVTAHEPFYHFMRTHVFEPLNMRDTTVDVATENIPTRASFYFPLFGLARNTKYGPKPARVGDYSCYAGAAAFLSTPSDLVRFGLGINNGTLLKPETVELLQKPQHLNSGVPTQHGLGWDAGAMQLGDQPVRMSGHGTKGGFIGGSTSLLTFPDRGLVVAVMANSSFADTKSVALKVAQAFAPAVH